MSLEYRKKRISELSSSWKMKKENDLFVYKKISKKCLYDLKNSVSLYVSRALDFHYKDEVDFMFQVEKNKSNRDNVTPNGAIVPKRDYQLEYNLFLKAWCNCIKDLSGSNPDLVKKFRLTPNLRIKYGDELEDNIGRGLNTGLPHSDAWVEGPWGMNCHVPLFGDTNNNFLHFYKLKDESLFDEDKFLAKSKSYKDMQWVLEFYESDNIIPNKNSINISDYALIHNTYRNPGCKARISIDTTIFIGDHEVHSDREIEYDNHIPNIGSDALVICNRKVSDQIMEKKTTFSHYSTGNSKRIDMTNFYD
tara:strand:- start:555 stop:1472 length:918 start_codon:yes stop_codon:yes gene_type:complete